MFATGGDLYTAGGGGTGGWTWAGTCGTSSMTITGTTVNVGSAVTYITSGYGGGGGGSSGAYAGEYSLGFTPGGSGGSGSGYAVSAGSDWQAQARAAREAQAVAAQRRQREAEERHQRQLAAAGRAEQLLLSFLTPEQARSYTEDGSFLVTGSAGGRWRIRHDGHMGNVDLLDEAGQVVAWYCIHPPGGLPDADAYLAQMLHLVTDEESFRVIGNAHPQANLAPVNLGPRRVALDDDFARAA